MKLALQRLRRRASSGANECSTVTNTELLALLDRLEEAETALATAETALATIENWLHGNARGLPSWVLPAFKAWQAIREQQDGEAL